jgi:hypothetical protein
VSNGFSEEELKAAQSLASGASQRRAAEAAGVARITIIRWLKKPDFREKVESLRQQFHLAQSEAFVDSAKGRVDEGAVTRHELVSIFSSILRDEEKRIGDRIKAGQSLAKWMGLENGNGITEPEPPELPAEAFREEDLCKHLELLKSQAVVAAQFLVHQALQKAASGEIQEAVAVLSRSLDLASDCVSELPQAANTLAKKGFVVLSRGELSEIASEKIPSELAYDRLFGWHYQKRSLQRR